MHFTDRYYNEMYELTKGSYFGEQHIMFGLRADINFMTFKHDRYDNILLKIDG